MATGAQVWSQVAPTNATIDTNINFAEGQAPSSLNDSCRSAMASVAKWISDNNGTVVTSGTTTAITAATNQIEGALTAGYTVAVQFANTPDAGATLAVDGLAAAPIQAVPGTNIAYGQLKAGSICRLTYSSTGTGQWIVSGAPSSVTTSTGFAPLASLTNSLSGNVTLTTTSYFDGPTVATLTTGIWYASGTITFYHPTLEPVFNAKLWDGTNVAGSAVNLPAFANFPTSISLSGIITNPTTGNIKISVSCSAGTHTGALLYNYSGNSADCTLTAVRIG